MRIFYFRTQHEIESERITPSLVTHALRTGCLGVQNKGNNKTVKTQDFSENENQDLYYKSMSYMQISFEYVNNTYHADKHSRLLSSSTNTSIASDTNSNTSGQARKANTQTSTKLDKTAKQGLLQSN